MIIGAGVAALILLVPPWNFVLKAPDGRIVRPAPFRLIVSPPDIPNDNSKWGLDTTETFHHFMGHDRSRWNAEIDFQRLIIMLATTGSIILIIVVGFGLAKKDNN